jgi:hypothetical protein
VNKIISIEIAYGPEYDISITRLSAM